MNESLVSILIPVSLISSLGLIFALVLSWVAKKFAVQHDPRIDLLLQILPGSNCGACGQAGCSGYAEALIFRGEAIHLCAPGRDEVALEIGKILGKEFSPQAKMVAKLLCYGGTINAQDRFEYQGLATCKAATQLFGGQKACRQACLGFGDCYHVCQFNAIHMANGLPVIDREKCTGCEACVKACPKNIIEMVPVESEVFVECINTDRGAITSKVCKVGCIACYKCEKICPYDAIHVKNFIAKIDYDKCTNCGKCVEVCPTKIIFDFRKKREKIVVGVSN